MTKNEGEPSLKDGMTEQISTWQRFAEVTIKTNDLDPMYSVIYGLNKTKSRKWMGLFIMTFLLYYDAGQATKLADECEDLKLFKYFDHLKYIAKDLPSFMKRGTERRHMRGENESKALEKLASFGLEPWDLLLEMYPDISVGRSYTAFYNWMTTEFSGTQFGPYFIWKLYDIFNVCLDMPISLNSAEAIKYMPDEPKKAALHFFPTFENDPFVFPKGLMKVTDYIGQFDHPVVPGRKCGLAEAETVLCMMKGFFKTKTHTIGDDIEDKLRQLVGHPELIELLPPRVMGEYVR